MRAGISLQAAESPEALTAYTWPGNVRELENVIERAVILSPGSTLRVDEPFTRVTPARAGAATAQSLEEIERAYIVWGDRGMRRFKGKGNAAERLGLNPRTLRSRVKKLGIQHPSAH